MWCQTKYFRFQRQSLCAIIYAIYFQSCTKTKVDFPLYLDLYELCKKDELSCGFYLKEELLECSGQDRQDTRLAYQLFSDKTAALFRRFYSKDDESKMAAADYCDLSHKGRFSTHISKVKALLQSTYLF